MSTLYLCYQSVLEPLTQTQVVAYLEGLALAGHNVLLLTFEPRPIRADQARHIRERLSRLGITWYWRRYHKRPTLPATAYDVAVGIATGLWLTHKHHVRLVHARSHVAALMGAAVKRLTGTRLLFDIRGFMAEEYVDAGTWPADGALFHATKRAERRLVNAADGMVVLAKAARDTLRRWYPAETRDKPIEVIPCCVDLRKIPREVAVRPRQSDTGPVLVYVGKLGGTYPVSAMVRFVALAAQAEPDLRWHVWTQSDPTALREEVARTGLATRTRIDSAPPDQLLQEITGAHIGICIYQRTTSAASTSPTKVGEYLGAGLAVVCTAGIGDIDTLLGTRGTYGASAAEAVGVTVDGANDEVLSKAIPALQRFAGDPRAPERCRSVAEAELDLVSVGWARYRSVYAALA